MKIVIRSRRLEQTLEQVVRDLEARQTRRCRRRIDEPPTDKTGEPAQLTPKSARNRRPRAASESLAQPPDSPTSPTSPRKAALGRPESKPAASRPQMPESSQGLSAPEASSESPIDDGGILRGVKIRRRGKVRDLHRPDSVEET